MEVEEERWADIKGYEEYYQVSDFGRVRSLDRLVKSKSYGVASVKGKLICVKPREDGYVHPSLNKEGKARKFYLHQLVAEAFVHNDSPNTKIQVDHLDGNKSNNHHLNLEWVTPSQNQQRAVTMGLRPRGENSQFVILTEEQVLEICHLLDTSGKTQEDIGNMYGIDQTAVSLIKTGKNWNWLTKRGNKPIDKLQIDE